MVVFLCHKLYGWEQFAVVYILYLLYITFGIPVIYPKEICDL